MVWISEVVVMLAGCSINVVSGMRFGIFFFNDTATTEIYTE